MSVSKVRFGTPEDIVPSRFAPQPKCEIQEGLPASAAPISFRVTHRGCLLTMPIDPSAGIYGFGLQFRSFNHRGSKKTMRPNADPLSASGDSHAPVPFFVTTEGFGLCIDTARDAVFCCGKVKKPESGRTAADTGAAISTSTEELYAVRDTGEETILTMEIPYAKGADLYYITGDTILSIVSQYNLLSGGGCMPPLWGLGGFYRCCSKFNAEQVLSIARRFRELDIPCDIIGLEPGWQTHAYSCSYLWDPGRFPEPEATVRALQKDGFHVNLWEHAFTHPTAPVYDALLPCSGDYLVWNGLVPDFTLKETREIFSSHQKTLTAIGVTGFKLDECDGSDFTGGWSFPDSSAFPSGMDGEQYHSLFGQLYAKTQMETLGDTRTLSEVRNLGLFAASYPFVLYSDLYKHRYFLTGVVNAGFSGLLWAPEVRHAEDAEDLIRRVQTVVFSAQALVNAWYLDRMPWEELGCTDAVRALFRIRMSLIPYLYTMFFDYETEGKPPIRALVCDFGEQPETRDCDDQYLFGDAMLVAPLTAPEKERNVFLPAGCDWFDFFTGERFAGGQTIRVRTDGIPVYVKENTILPVAEPETHISPDTQFRISLRVYGKCDNAVCRLIEDDGETYSTGRRVLRVSADGRMPDSFRYKITEILHIQ